MPTLYKLSGNNPVGQITVCADFHSLYEQIDKHVSSTAGCAAYTENGDIDMTTSNHAETLHTVKRRSTGNQRNGFLASVDDIGIHLLSSRERTHSEDTVLRLQPDVSSLGQEGGNQCWHTDTEVDVEAVL